MKRFGELVREARTSKHMSLTALAKVIQSFKGYVSMIETGMVAPPSPKIITKLCKVLELDYGKMLARSAFEKLPKGLQYHLLEEVLDEARVDGLSKAAGRVVAQ